MGSRAGQSAETARQDQKRATKPLSPLYAAASWSCGEAGLSHYCWRACGGGEQLQSINEKRQEARLHTLVEGNEVKVG